MARWVRRVEAAFSCVDLLFVAVLNMCGADRGFQSLTQSPVVLLERCSCMQASLDYGPDIPHLNEMLLQFSRL